ncbi:MAG: hypothetical protein KF899_15380 [Parvibaculum sp.]|nr:hypothetical protein [Parvibaculum sp.]
MPASSHTKGPVIVIWLGSGGPARRAALAPLRVRHAGAPLILLTTPDGARAADGLADEIWSDGAARGAAAFLVRARRLSWASPAIVYDLEGSPATRFLRFCVWPRPQWRLVARGGEVAPLS